MVVNTKKVLALSSAVFDALHKYVGEAYSICPSLSCVDQTMYCSVCSFLIPLKNGYFRARMPKNGGSSCCHV